jgi:hypothetical protein
MEVVGLGHLVEEMALAILEVEERLQTALAGLAWLLSVTRPST